MAWNIKYFGEWKDLNDNDNRLEILTNENVTEKEVRITSFVIDYSSIDLFSDKAVYGCGAKFSLMSESKLFFLDELYTIKPQGLKVIHYLNSNINYVGFLDTEQYTDEFSNQINYNVDLTSNNGIAVLDRIAISDNNDDNLNDIYKAIDVIKYGLNKLSIDFNKIHIGLSTDTTNELASDETILHKLYVKGDNYVDEKGNWMSCREVINDILLPIYGKIYLYENDIYILDINEIAKDNNINLKVYDFSSLDFIENTTIDNLNDIDVRLGDYSLTMRPGVNKVDLKFNKYLYDNPSINEISSKTIYNNYGSSTVTNSDGIRYEVKKYESADNFVTYTDKYKTYFEKITNTDKPQEVDYTLRLEGQTPFNETPVYNVKVNTALKLFSSKQLYIKLAGDFMVADDSDRYVERIIKDYYDTHFYLQFQIGDYYYDNFEGWTTTEKSVTVRYFDYYTDENQDARFTVNKYFDLENATYDGNNPGNAIIIPLNSDLFESDTSIEGGDLSIKIGMYEKVFDDMDYVLRFKDFGVKLVEKDEYENFIEVDNNDDEYQGKIDVNYINDLKVVTKHGTDIDNVSRGVFLVNVTGNYQDSDYATNERLANANEFVRESETGKLEELLLRSYLSNMQQSRYILKCTLMDYYKPFNIFNLDTINKSDKQITLYPTQLSLDYVESTAELELTEIVKDE